jgi:hypothetical protein
VVKDVVQINMRSGFIPSLLDHIGEAGHVDPKFLKPEGFRLQRSKAQVKDHRAMVRE